MKNTKATYLSRQSAVSIWGALDNLNPSGRVSTYLSSVINSAILALLRELESACEVPLASLAKITWTGIANVSGSSAYMNNLTASIEQVISIIRPLIDQKRYLRNLLDKASL